jgi:hypothetical protein
MQTNAEVADALDLALVLAGLVGLIALIGSFRSSSLLKVSWDQRAFPPPGELTIREVYHLRRTLVSAAQLSPEMGGSNRIS